MSKKKQKERFICVRCPRGCEIQTTLDGYIIEAIEGNLCKLGIDYVKDEITDPKRIVTSTVKVKGGDHPLVPVWTNDTIPKNEIFELMIELRSIELKAPVNVDHVVVHNFKNTGVDVITSGKVMKN